MVGIRKASIFFFIILMAGFTSNSFFCPPLYAEVYVPYHPYQPQILYLGRHNYLEELKLPSKPEDAQSKYIYAIVHDMYGKIKNGTLSYTIDNIKEPPIAMKLVTGIPADGTWWGIIPLKKPNVPYKVLYNVSFADDLGYSTNKSGPYSSLSDEFVGRQGFQVADRYILVDGQLANIPHKDAGVEVTASAKSDNFTALVSDDGRKIENVTLYLYKIYSGHWVKALPPLKMKVSNSTGWDDLTYRAHVNTTVIPNLSNNKLGFYSTVFESNSKGNPGYFNSTEGLPDITDPSIPRVTPNTIYVGNPGYFNSTDYLPDVTDPSILHNTVYVTTNVSDIDISSQRASMQIKLNGTLINASDFTIPPSAREWQRENLKLQVIDYNNGTSTTREQTIPASFHNRTNSIGSLGFGFFQATIGKGNNSGIGSLRGNQSAFPLDQYNIDLNISIPFKDVSIRPYNPEYGSVYRSAWNPVEIQQDGNFSCTKKNIESYICDSSNGNSTTVKVHLHFYRNDFTLWAVTFPIIFIFFLLGSICFLEPKGNYLGARLAITLGVFAFVFAFDTILMNVKPHNIQNTSTFADFLLKLVLVAAIASTISSVIGYRIVKMAGDSKERLRNTIQEYYLYDLLPVVMVLVIIIHECVLTNPYSLEISRDFVYPMIIIIGSGWGLVYRVLSALAKNQAKNKEPESIQKISEQYNEDDLRSAMKIVKELQKIVKVEELGEKNKDD